MAANDNNKTAIELLERFRTPTAIELLERFGRRWADVDADLRGALALVRELAFTNRDAAEAAAAENLLRRSLERYGELVDWVDQALLQLNREQGSESGAR